MFKLKLQNVVFWAIAPSVFINYSYSQSIDDRVDNIWRIHENREKRNMGDTVSKTGFYESDQHVGDRGMPFHTGIQFGMERITRGTVPKSFLNNPFTRFNE